MNILLIVVGNRNERVFSLASPRSGRLPHYSRIDGRFPRIPARERCRISRTTEPASQSIGYVAMNILIAIPESVKWSGQAALQ